MSKTQVYFPSESSLPGYLDGEGTLLHLLLMKQLQFFPGQKTKQKVSAYYYRFGNINEKKSITSTWLIANPIKNLKKQAAYKH